MKQHRFHFADGQYVDFRMEEGSADKATNSGATWVSNATPDQSSTILINLSQVTRIEVMGAIDEY